jgi:hypothetical protein
MTDLIWNEGSIPPNRGTNAIWLAQCGRNGLVIGCWLIESWDLLLYRHRRCQDSTLVYRCYPRVLPELVN